MLDPKTQRQISLQLFWVHVLPFSKCWLGTARREHAATWSGHMTSLLWRSTQVAPPPRPLRRGLHPGGRDLAWGCVSKPSPLGLVCPGPPSRSDWKMWQNFDVIVEAGVSGITSRSARLSWDISYLEMWEDNLTTTLSEHTWFWKAVRELWEKQRENKVSKHRDFSTSCF